MDRADIIRQLRPDTEKHRSYVALVEALHILETSEHEYVAALARKEAMDVELRTKRAATDRELDQLERKKTQAMRDAATATDLERARLAASLDGLRAEVTSITKKKEDIQKELQEAIVQRAQRLGELDARVRDLESRQSQANKALDAAALAAKR